MNPIENWTLSDIRDLLKRARCENYLEDRADDIVAYLGIVKHNLVSFSEVYAKRFGEIPNIAELLRRNPEKGEAFIQWLAGEELSTDFAILIWRILSGAEVLALSYRYEKERESVLEIDLEPLPGSPQVGGRERYRSASEFDFHVLSEFRMIGFNGKPYLFGAFRSVL
jgi:hypothetical protein